MPVAGTVLVIGLFSLRNQFVQFRQDDYGKLRRGFAGTVRPARIGPARAPEILIGHQYIARLSVLCDGNAVGPLRSSRS